MSKILKVNKIIGTYNSKMVTKVFQLDGLYWPLKRWGNQEPINF